MKQKQFHILTVFLALLLPFNAWAALEPYAVLSDDNTVLTFYYDENKDTRNGMSVGPFVNNDDCGWYSNRTTITSVVFDASFANCTTLTSTGRWFNGCSNLTTISGIENLKTDNVTDMRMMFCDCSNLAELDVSGFKTDNVSNMNSVFSGCSKLTFLDVSNFNTENVTSMHRMFYNCNSLTFLDVSNFKTDNVTSMEGMFYFCRGLSVLDVSGFNTAKVVYLNEMFDRCSGLTSLDVSGFKTDKARNLYAMFRGCSLLTSLDVSGFNTANVGDFRGMFAECRNLTSLDVSGFNTTSATKMTQMFYYCENLTGLDTGNFTNDNVTDVSSMFEFCSKLAVIDLSGFTNDKVEYMSGMFYGCSNLTTIYASEENWSIANVKNGENMFYRCTKLKGGNGTSYSINYTGLEYACIDESDSKGYLTNKMHYMPYAVLSDDNTVLTFYYNVYRKSKGGISIGPFNKSEDRGWYGNRSTITSVVFDKSFAKCKTLTNTSYWFEECSNLATISGLENLNTDYVQYMRKMFYKCSSLTNVDLRIGETSDMYYMFSDCTGLKTVNIGNSVTSIGDHAFENCIGLNSFTIPESVTSIEEYAFYNCCYLTSITIPNSVKTIGNSAFYKCQSAEFVDIGNSVETIGDYAFYGINNSSLAYITIPASVKSIGYKAFYWSFPKEIRCYIQEPFPVEQAFTKTILYVPVGTKAKYEATGGWDVFENIVEMVLEEVGDDEEIAFGGEDSQIDENTDLDGNVVGNILYNISPGNGQYNPVEGCIEVTKTTSDEEIAAIEGKDIFGEDVRRNFTGIMFKIPAGKGSVTIEAETTGNMEMKVKFGNQEPMELVLVGKMKMKVPYNVDQPTIVYIYAAEMDANAARSRSSETDKGILKIYGIEVSNDASSTKGDVDGNGTTDAADIIEIVNYITGNPSDGFDEKAADVNGDGVVDIADIIQIVNNIIGK